MKRQSPLPTTIGFRTTLIWTIRIHYLKLPPGSVCCIGCLLFSVLLVDHNSYHSDYIFSQKGKDGEGMWPPRTNNLYAESNYTSCDLNTTNHPVSSGWVSTCYVLVKEDLSLFLKNIHKSTYLKPLSVQISIISCKYVFTCLCVWLVTEIFICPLYATWKKISSVPPTARIQSFSKYVVFWPGEKTSFHLETRRDFEE